MNLEIFVECGTNSKQFLFIREMDVGCFISVGGITTTAQR